jgi:4-hydroxybenzoate polyprenyltransferase
MSTVEDVVSETSTSVPLVVDLDGTLVKTDVLLEAVFALLKRNVFYALLFPLWLLRGKAAFKAEIASRVDVDPALLPYHEDFLAYLKDQHKQGRSLVLATASSEKFARAIARHTALFSEVLASSHTDNLSGQRKLERLQERFENDEFDYAGNAMVDLQVWSGARAALLVNPERGVKAAAEAQGEVSRVFDDRSGVAWQRYLKALRLHQWLKNLLIFVPLFMSHKFDDPALLAQAILAFVVFGLCASSVYLLNDLLDLPDDRRHPTKCNRPFAAGSVSVISGALLIPCLLLPALLLSLFLPVEFFGVLALYYAVTLAYSLRLKRAALIDVLTLAGLYTVRIIAGAAAVSVVLSFWLLAFSMFLFLSLALIKRFTELLTMQQQDRLSAAGRDYFTSDLETLAQFGSASAYMSVLVLALYINSSDVRTLYAHPEVIWLLCPLLLYLVMRMWLLARRNQLNEDPVVWVIRDRRSQLLALIGALLLWMAI